VPTPDRETIEAEASHARARLELYRARVYAGKPTTPGRLRELERIASAAEARLSRYSRPRPGPE
jgi:hypothetical protein